MLTVKITEEATCTLWKSEVVILFKNCQVNKTTWRLGSERLGEVVQGGCSSKCWSPPSKADLQQWPWASGYQMTPCGLISPHLPTPSLISSPGFQVLPPHSPPTQLSCCVHRMMYPTPWSHSFFTCSMPVIFATLNLGHSCVLSCARYCCHPEILYF